MSSAQDLSRLEKQNLQKQYSLLDELQFLQFKNGDVVLDAGCGSGLVTRAIHDSTSKKLVYEACDYSEVAVSGAQKNFQDFGINAKTFISSLDDIKAENDFYDVIVCRYVLEHMSNPEKAVNEFHRVLRHQGKAYLIDLDGMLFNLFTDNQELNIYLDVLRNRFKFDLNVGKRLTHLLKESGFNKIEWKASIMEFSNLEDRIREYENYTARLTLAKNAIVDAFGGDSQYEDFVSLYLKELADPRNPLVYTKYIAIGEK